MIPPGEKQTFELHCFDQNGRFLRSRAAAATLARTRRPVGRRDERQRACGRSRLGRTVTASLDGLTATARIRVFRGTKEWSWNFDGFSGPAVPPSWVREFAKLKPMDLDGNTVMAVAGMGTARGRPSHTVWIGPPESKNYTIQADVRTKEQRRQLSNIGVTANRYTLMLKGTLGKLQVQSWPPHLRMAKDVPFKAEPEVWYTLKFKVEVRDGQAYLFGKAWKTGEAEPEAWTLEHVDPHANESGSPGLYFYATTDCMFDNVRVTFD